MGQKNFLKELLKEDQEPFQLKDYIADRKCQLQKQTSLRESSQAVTKPHHHQQQQIQLLKKPKKPITTSGGTTKSFSTNFCKNACFFSSKFHESPDFRKSPLFEFPSPLQGSYKSPCRVSKSNPLFLHVPAKTATLLLEAAMRIQQKQTNPSSKSNNATHLKSSGFRLFGSMIKRLTNRKRDSSSSVSTGSGREELAIDNNGEIVRWSAAGRRNLSRDDIDILDQNAISRERLSTSVCWSEEQQQNSNGGMELRSCSTSTGTGTRTTSTSCSSSSSSICRFEDDEDNYEFVNVLERENDNNYGDIDGDFGLCPVGSPFRFALYKSPSPDHHHHHHQYYDRRSPVVFSSPAAETSPTRRKFQDNVNYEHSVKFQAEEEEDDKEQNSPVSILDPPFEDDDQGHDDDEEDGYDLDCSYAFVQRAKQQLLHKLHRFEKLAELDPLELDGKMAEEEQEEEYDDYNLNEDEEENETYMKGLVREMITKSCYEEIQKPGMKRLLSDIITYEEQEDIMDNDDTETALALVKRVCTRLDSWKQVESNTIDMMVGMDLRREGDFWKNHKEQISETATEIECHIFAVLVDELTGELVC